MWVSFGWTSSAGILVTSNASSAALTTIRRPSLVAPEPQVEPPGGRAQPAVREAAIPSCYGFVHRLFAPAVDWPDARHDRRRRGPRDRRRGPGPEAPGLLLRARLRRRQRGLRRPCRRLRARPPRGHVRPPRARRERPARRRRTPTRSTAWPPTCRPSPTPPASTICGCSATRWAAWWCARFVLARPDRVARRRVHGHLGRTPPGSTPSSCAFGVGGRLDTGGLAVLKQLSDELDLLGSAAHQRVLAERPGFREYGDHKWSAAVAGDVEHAHAMEHRRAARPARRAGGAARVPRSGSSATRTRTFLEPMRDIVGDGAGRRARGHARCRPLAAVREPADLAEGDRRASWRRRPAPSGAGRPRVSRRRPSP